VCDAGEQQVLEKRMAAAGFDLDKYHHLMRTRERYKRYMGISPAAAAAAPDQPDAAATHGKDSS
jgi:hypothetical protein